MKRCNKKGFTIVELVIVIAVIAILAAVLIPTIAGLVSKAQQSADIQAVRQMNVALASAEKESTTIVEAANVLSNAGFNTEKGLTPAYKNYSFYWHQATNQVVYVNEADDKFELVFPENVKGFSEDTCVPLSVAIDAVISAPAVESTTSKLDSSFVSNIADEYKDASFNDLMAYLTNGTDKDVVFTDANGVVKSGIALSSGTIKLDSDIILDTTNTPSGIGNVGNTLMINIYGDVTIDLNGHSIVQYGNGQSMNLFLVRDGATLNITDSSADKSGAIYASLGMFQVDAGATVNLFSGKLAVTANEHRSGADINAGVSIVSMNGGTFNMYGGTIDATSESADESEFAFSGYGKSTSIANIYDGTIVGNIYDEWAGTVTDFRTK